MNRIIICDIDNTIADIGHRVEHLSKSPKDWDKFFSLQRWDKPFKDMVGLIAILHNYAFVFFVTGRPEKYRHETREWLRKHNIPDFPLYMRPEGNREDDSKIKLEIIKDIEKTYKGKVWFVLEDRARVVKALRENDYRVLQVKTGDF